LLREKMPVNRQMPPKTSRFDNLGKAWFMVDMLADGVSSKRFSRLLCCLNNFMVKYLH
jgi:hypothetical protein